MTTDVDVLIIGAGASGAALAWSLAETRMRILCLEQGDWVNPADYPSTRRDWEVRMDREFSPNPNVRRRPEDYPINDDDSPISVVNFNGVGGSTILYAAHFPRPHPSDFRVRSLDGVADDWPINYASLEPFYALNDRQMGVPGLPAARTASAACSDRPRRRDHGTRVQCARLALVALGHRDRHPRVRRPRSVREPGAVQGRVRAGRQGERRHHLLAARAARRRAAAHALPGARDPGRRQRHGHRRRLLRRARCRASAAVSYTH